MRTDRSKYIFSADVIRAIAIFGVVIIHTANSVYARLDFFGGISWFFAIFLESLSRASIPLFIMLSGYLILGKDESFEKSLKRILTRVLIPLVIWTVFYMWWNGGNPSIVHIDKSIFLLLFSGRVFHLYFLSIIIGLYAFSSLIRNYLYNLSVNSQKFFLWFFLIAGVVEVFLEFIFQRCTSESIFSMWIPYTGYFVAGYLIGNRKIVFSNLKTYFALGIGVFSTIGFNYLHYYLHLHGKNFLEGQTCLTYYTDYYLSVNVVLFSVAAFIILLNLNYSKIENTKFGNFIKSVARSSFAIYLIHIAVIDILSSKYKIFDPIAPAWLYVLIKWITIFGVSYLLSFILIKIPIIKKVFGEK